MKTVWKFTNKKELTEKEFVEYFERKVKGTIRKYSMPIGPCSQKSINAEVINHITNTLAVRKGKVSSQSMDDVSIAVLREMMFGKAENLKRFLPKNQPLYFLSESEIQLYAKIKNLKGNISKRSKEEEKINDFIKKIEQKNPDIRHNIVKAIEFIS